MEYEHIVEERDYEYGPGKELADLETAKTYVSKVRNQIYKNRDYSKYLFND